MSELYIFHGGNELVEVKVNGKEVHIRSRITNGKFVSVKDIFKAKQPDKLKEYEEKVSLFDVDTFRNYIFSEFRSMGYITYQKKPRKIND